MATRGKLVGNGLEPDNSWFGPGEVGVIVSCSFYPKNNGRPVLLGPSDRRLGLEQQRMFYLDSPGWDLVGNTVIRPLAKGESVVIEAV